MQGHGFAETIAKRENTMIFMPIRRLFFRRNKKATKAHSSAEPKTKSTIQVDANCEVPAWQQVLTASFKANALAPSEEVILHAFDLYCEELNAPFNERRQMMSERFSNITSGFAHIQSLAPDMVERAAAKHRLELSRFVDHKGNF